MGARAYRYLCLYDPAPGCVVEVGSERGEGSTAWLAAYAKRHGLRFYSADIDSKVHRKAKRITKGARLCSGVEILKRVRTVSIAYLDGFDWSPEGVEEEWLADQRDRYEDLGYAMTNAKSQTEHLEEAKLVTRKAAARCVVICDDTFVGTVGWDGKGGQAVPHLLSHGFEVVQVEEPDTHSLGAVVLVR
jgi:hypothetical protein